MATTLPFAMPVVHAPDSARQAPATTCETNGWTVEDLHDQPPGTSWTSGPRTNVDDPARVPGSWTFAAIGDYGAGSKEQAKVAASLLARDPKLVVTMGDNAYDFGTELEWRLRWDPKKYFGAIRDSRPVFPSLGNHDVRLGTGPYFRRFPQLDKARYYDFERDGVHFFALDSTQSLEPGSPQTTWLRGRLADAGADDYRVVYMHHPVKTSSERGRDSRLEEYLGDVLQDGRVDLVLAGHEHQYERSKPINDYGTVHVLSGTGGKDSHPFESAPAAWSAHRSNGFGHVEFEVTPDALVGRNVLMDGSVDDVFRIPRGGTVGAAAGAAQLAASR